MQNIIIDSIKDEYLDGIIEIENDCFFPPWSRDAYKKEISAEYSEYVVLVQDGLVVGYGGFRQALDQADITNIAIRKGFRNSGLGTHIINSLFDKAKKRGINTITLEVRKSNLSAIALYEKTGFINMGIRPGFYQDGEDAFIMSKKL